MEIKLTLHELRVLGSLIEKSVTTPDYYPLTLNALLGACNQKSNREPVMTLSQDEVLNALETLIDKKLLNEKSPGGARVTKYAHRLSNTLGLTFSFSHEELAVLCVLMLRGPQTVGEIRSRGARLCKFENLSQVDATLQRLAIREDGPFVRRLERQVGRKESRYMHLLGEQTIPQATSTQSDTDESNPSTIAERLLALENEVAELRSTVQELKARWGA